ncbi:MAG: AAA family ATPase [Sodalinema sp.]|uniref:ATP-binding protein n=1 Tax=Sodalinema sp. TaxID=3080550 RepID=UPI001209414B|nr:MAG: ATP-binding protein [Phormidium sp. SL48-SHIP]
MIASLDLATVYRACNPSQTLDITRPQDRRYYVDLSKARGGDLLGELDATIRLFCPQEPTCQLLAGHIGCGKSTELRRLQARLQNNGFAVVYFESSQDLDMADLDVGDILLAIARQVYDSFGQSLTIEPAGQLFSLIKTANSLVATDIPTLDRSPHRDGFGRQLQQLSARTHGRPDLRSQLRQYLEPRIQTFLDAFNNELINPVVQQLREQNKAGLVILVDNLDRLETNQKPWGRPQPEYLFVDRGDRLCKLNCHVVYTIPSSLLFSRDLSRLTMSLGLDPKVLPMVAVQQRQGSLSKPGLRHLRQLILARAFPDASPQARQQKCDRLFDHPQTLNRLCYASGGHPRNLLRLFHRQIEKERQFPLSQTSLKLTLRERRDQLLRSISHDERDLLKFVVKHKKISGDADYQSLIHSLLIFEYRDNQGSWFDVNPLLKTATFH